MGHCTRMLARKGLGGRYPPSFCEWVVGTTIEDALGPRAARPLPKQRAVVKVEVATDYETEEDSISITYPRSSRTATAPVAAQVVAKKVRFQDASKKSALKKTAAASSESGPETSDSPAASRSEESSSEAESPGSSAETPSKPKRAKNIARSSGGYADSEPHPTGKCRGCVEGRARLTEQATSDETQSSATESEVSLSESDSGPEAPAKPKSKGGRKSVGRSDEPAAATNEAPAAAKSKAKTPPRAAEQSHESEADDEASDPAKDGKAEDKATKASRDSNAQASRHKSHVKSNGHGREARKHGRADKSKATKDGKAAQRAEPATAGGADETVGSAKAGVGADRRSEKKKAKAARIKSSYPEAFPGPHALRPHLLEPIRAEVVQTERVVEGAEDPPPNAYYDAAHGLLHIYHGPVWGNNHGHALTPTATLTGRCPWARHTLCITLISMGSAKVLRLLPRDTRVSATGSQRSPCTPCTLLCRA